MAVTSMLQHLLAATGPFMLSFPILVSMESCEEEVVRLLSYH